MRSVITYSLVAGLILFGTSAWASFSCVVTNDQYTFKTYGATFREAEDRALKACMLHESTSDPAKDCRVLFFSKSKRTDGKVEIEPSPMCAVLGEQSTITDNKN